MEEVGDEQPTSRLYKPGLFEARGEQSEQSYAEEKPSQSHVDVEKLLRRSVGSFLGAPDVCFACRFLYRVLEIWKNMTRSVLYPFGIATMYF